MRSQFPTQASLLPAKYRLYVVFILIAKIQSELTDVFIAVLADEISDCDYCHMLYG